MALCFIYLCIMVLWIVKCVGSIKDRTSTAPAPAPVSLIVPEGTSGIVFSLVNETNVDAAFG